MFAVMLPALLHLAQPLHEETNPIGFIRDFNQKAFAFKLKIQMFTMKILQCVPKRKQTCTPSSQIKRREQDELKMCLQSVRLFSVQSRSFLLILHQEFIGWMFSAMTQFVADAAVP